MLLENMDKFQVPFFLITQLILKLLMLKKKMKATKDLHQNKLDLIWLQIYILNTSMKKLGQYQKIKLIKFLKYHYK